MNFARKLLRALGPEGGRGLALLTVLVTMASLLEVAGMGAVMQFMGWIESPGRLSSPAFAPVRHFLGLEQQRELLITLGLSVVVLLAFGKAFNAFALWSQHRYVWQQDKLMSTRLLVSFLSRPYDWFLRQNGAHLNRYLNSREFSSNLLAGVTDMISATLVTLILLTSLFWVDPWVALITMLGVALAQTCLLLVTRNPIRRWSDEAHELLHRRAVVGQEAMAGIKPLLSFARESCYVDEFVRLSERGSQLQAWREMVWDIPRFFLEAVALGLLLCLTLYFVIWGGITRLLPMLSLYAMAGYRVIPAVHLLFHSLTRIRSSLPALDAYLEFIEESPGRDLSPPSERLRMTQSLRLERLVFRYSDEGAPALQQLDLEIRPKELIGIVGSTGSGKTTLTDILMGLLSPSAGCFSVDGQVLDSESQRHWRGSVGYVPQNVFLSDDTVSRNIAFAVPPAKADQQAVIRAAEAAHIGGFIESLPLGYDTPVGDNGVRLSGGQRQRIGIARALYADPDLLIFDEATSSLDSVTEDAVMQAIGALSSSKTIVLVAHRLQTVKNCDRIYVLEAGRVAATGTYDELLKTSPAFQALARSAPAVAALEG